MHNDIHASCRYIAQYIHHLFAYYLLKMSNKRELSALNSELGQDSAEASKAPKKSNAAGKKTTNPTPLEQTYIIKQKTNKQAGLMGRDDHIRVFLPKTKLGDKVDKYLYWTFVEEEENHESGYEATEEITAELTTLLENAGEEDIAPFYQELNGNFMGSLTFFADGEGGTFQMSIKEGLKNEKGSAIDQMKAFAKWYAMNQDTHYYGYNVEGLDWLIAKIEAKKSN